MIRPFYSLAIFSAIVFAPPAEAQIKPTLSPAAVTGQLPAITDVQARTDTKAIIAKKLILVGDSTTQVGSGWGGAFCSSHVTSVIACVNLGRGGRSTFSYRAEGSWDLALSEMKVPGFVRVYVMIQFGHNDQPGKPGRSTDLATEFPDNLRAYINDVRAAGAIPILVTPLTRRVFKDGSLQDDLEPWAQSVRDVAHGLNVPLVDLHAVSVATVQAMGARQALDLAETAPPPEVLAAAQTGTTISLPKTVTPAVPNATEMTEGPQAHPTVVFDYTHLGPKGAGLFSTEVAMELARVVPDLRSDLVP